MRILDGKPVETISAFFEDEPNERMPSKLKQNATKLYEGSKWICDGFLLSHNQAEKIISSNRSNSSVVLPIINGDEINSHPSQQPARSAVYFADWTLERAQRFPEALDWLVRTVKEEREQHSEEALRRKWWLFKRPTTELYRLIHPLSRCFAFSRHTKHFVLAAQPTTILFTEALKILTSDRWSDFAVVQSTIHEIWARKYSGALETRLRYSPSDCFETFAFPAGQWQQPNPDLAAIGERYHEHRRDLMLRLWLGLTDIYNLFHARDLERRLEALFKKRMGNSEWRMVAGVPAEHIDVAGSLSLEEAIAGIEKLRALHVELDYTVLEAYGWGKQANRELRIANGADATVSSSPHSPFATHHSQEIVLGHDFQQVETLPENDRTRYTISLEARKELLKRLLKLNHKRAAEEGATPTSIGTKKAQREKKEDELI